MNKSELITVFAEKTGLASSEAAAFVNGFFAAMKERLADGDRVEVRGFGSFALREYKAYSGRNPKTGDLVTVASKKLPFFKAGKELKEFINK